VADLTPDDALIEACVIAAMSLEVHDPAELAIVERCVPAAALGLAVFMAETDPEFRGRWGVAENDPMATGQVLHEVLLFLLRPETTAASS
jgi:hypothetical protein